MTVYVLGAGASRHAGYPLGCAMGTELIAWMKRHPHPLYDYPTVATQIEEWFAPVQDVDGIFEKIAEITRDYENGNEEQRRMRSYVASRIRPALTEAIRDWFLIVRSAEADFGYISFANNVVRDNDYILSFNYDVSVERRLKVAGKWDVGDGYGFHIEGLPNNSPTKLLKLHGSTNWLALMDGLPVSGPAQVSCVFASPRPAIGTRELDFLGYPSSRDPIFPNGRPALPAMIAGRNKHFQFDTSFGPEFGTFWGGLWEQAAAALETASRIVICGYSLPAVDEAACSLLLNVPSKQTEIVVICGEQRSPEIVSEYRQRGYLNVTADAEPCFEQWVNQIAGRAACA